METCKIKLEADYHAMLASKGNLVINKRKEHIPPSAWRTKHCCLLSNLLPKWHDRIQGLQEIQRNCCAARNNKFIQSMPFMK